MKLPLKLYVCGIAAHWELGYTDVRTYHTAKALMKGEKCVKECGVVELTVTKVRTVRKSKPFVTKSGKKVKLT